MFDRELFEPGSIFDRPPSVGAEYVAELARYGVSTLSTALAGPLARQRLIDGEVLRRVAGSGVVAGPAITVWNAPGSARMNTPATELAEPGDVLVIRGDRETVQWGDIASTLAAARGLVGVIVDAAVRDIDRLKEIGVSVWGARIYAGMGFQTDPGLVNTPITVGGVLVRPGDMIVADTDGILVLDPAHVRVACERAQAMAEREAGVLSQVGQGLVPPNLRDVEVPPTGIAATGVLRYEHRLARDYPD
jgi:4-hydroxy-4-methyl-2-oxoglutarate aldolase